MSTLESDRFRILFSARKFALAFLLFTLSVMPMQAIVLAATSPAQQSSLVPKNVVLFYDDYPTRKDPDFQVTREIVRPLVAHLDRSGRATDWMFDSFIFYSVYLYYDRGPSQTYISSWIRYLFRAGKQASNLDAIVGELKSELQQETFQLNVFLSVAVPIEAVEADRIIKNVDKMLDEWNSLNPRHLRLIGFYWGFTEGLRMGDSRELDRAVPRAVADHLHARSLKLLLIPSMSQARRYVGEFHSLGFDYVTVQPNFATKSDGDLSRFELADQMVTSGNADGVEFETPLDVKWPGGDMLSNVNTYFAYAQLYGWNENLMNTYYHGSAISSMWRNSNESYRAAYETIYQFILTTQ